MGIRADLARWAVAAGMSVALAACVSAPQSAAQSASAAEPTLADREAIEETLYRYARGLDRLDPEFYASAFAEDGEFDLGANVVTGREALAGVVQGIADNRRASAERGEPYTIFHMDANPRIEFLSPDHAIHHAYWFTIRREGEGAEETNVIIDTGSSTDEMRKIDGEWLIVKRTITPEP